MITIKQKKKERLGATSKRFSIYSAAGFSMIEILLSTCILGIVAGAVAVATSQNMLFASKVPTEAAYRDIELSLRAALASALQQQMLSTAGNVCGGASLSFDQVLGVDNLTASLAAQLPALPSGAPASMLAASSRCASGAFRSPPSSPDFYFCLQVSSSNPSSYSKTSAAGAKLVFAEVEAQAIDVIQGTPLSCAAFAQMVQGLPNQGTGTLRIAYSLYWYNLGSANHFQFQQRNGKFFASISPNY